MALALLAALLGPGPARSAPTPKGETVKVLVAVLPFEVHSAQPLDHLETSLAELLTTRLEATGEVQVLDTVVVREALIEHVAGERTDELLRRLAREVGADWVVEGSLTELAGSFSLDVRVTPSGERLPTRTMVFTASGQEELLERVNELADRVLEIVSGEVPGGGVLEVRLEGAERLDEEEIRARLRTRVGEVYDGDRTREDLAMLRSLPGVATATASTERLADGVVVTFRLVPAERILGRGESQAAASAIVAEVKIVGNKRIEADAIRARITTRPGDPYSAVRVAEDVRSVHALGFFKDVRVYSESTAAGRVLTFQIEENPIVRQITIAGNESIDSDRIRDQLTLTTGATLDVPLLLENRDRVEALYRAEGYYLADVRYEIDQLPNDAVAVHFEVVEGGKLRLREIRFSGNEHFSDKQLRSGFRTKPWRFWSYVTRYLDKSGTYAEPVFLQDLQLVETKYTDAGYLRVEVGEPVVSTEDKGLVVSVDILEGERFKVGELDMEGDVTADVSQVRETMALSRDEWFNRSHLTQDVDRLTQSYTDRGFYEATVSPRTQIDEDTRTVDVMFDVRKGPLYFVRNIDITGNTRTVDRIVRREMQIVEGELYSARALNLSKARLDGLGFFEEVTFDVRETDQPEEIDLGVRVVEKPTGSLSFGAGFSTRDRFVISGSLAQDNLFGRGYGVRLSVDWGGERRQFFASFTNRRLFDSEFSLAATAFRTELGYDSYDETGTGVDITVGRALDEANRTRGFLRYTFNWRTIDSVSNIDATSAVFRQFLTDNVTTSMMALSLRGDLRNDRVLAWNGYEWAASVDGAGLGGFSRFLRFEGRTAWYFRPPSWIPWGERSSIMLAARVGYTLPFNLISDYTTPGLIPSDIATIAQPDFNTTGQIGTIGPIQGGREVAVIDDDLKLPLSERYFLGGLGTFQLRGYKARSVGPRRSILRRSGPIGAPGSGGLFRPVGRDPITGACDDTRIEGIGSINGGNGNGKCNSIHDRDDDDFADLEETDVVGGSSFISTTAEYRFPISEQLGLMGIVFLDMGNAFYEDESLPIIDVTKWRFGTGVGALWFSPFGPLQAFVGFPLNPIETDDSVVFEFSVGGSGI